MADALHGRAQQDQEDSRQQEQDQHNAHLDRRAVGFFFFFGSVGWTFIPMLIGLVARRTHIQRGFLVAAGSNVVFLVFLVARGLMR